MNARTVKKGIVRLEYFNHTADRFVVIEVPRTELWPDGPYGQFIVRGIERYGARVIEDISDGQRGQE